jgi:two-component system sensor histidine kinase HydH
LVQQDLANKNIDFKVHTENGVCAVLVDPDRLTQCLLNLYLNAIQAMESGGTLTVKCTVDETENVNISVSDTGKGIPSEQLKKIFDPYFTTKNKGTGLGLAIVHKIIEAHGGQIEVDSTIDEGTSVLIRIPCEQEQSGEGQNGNSKND